KGGASALFDIDHFEFEEGAPVNEPPVVVLTDPDDGEEFDEGETITLRATASDPDGNIDEVTFFDGSDEIGSDSSSPYTLSWTNASVGNHTLTAVAEDNDGATTTSDEVVITVVSVIPSNLPPTISITKSDNGDEFTEGGAITIRATADDPDG